MLGGPIGAYESAAYPFLDREVALLEQRLPRDLPTLGICLGSQLMARALCARVFAGAVKEIGWGPVTLSPEGQTSCLAPLAEGAGVLHWHGDTFDLPAGTGRLASTANYENQAFAYGKNGLGLQFHLEADPGQLRHGLSGMLSNWQMRELRSRRCGPRLPRWRQVFSFKPRLFSGAGWRK